VVLWAALSEAVTRETGTIALTATACSALWAALLSSLRSEISDLRARLTRAEEAEARNRVEIAKLNRDHQAQIDRIHRDHECAMERAKRELLDQAKAATLAIMKIAETQRTRDETSATGSRTRTPGG
jgi:NAD-dependent oxidoreductase involved in siderophore biosynthesis